ncbi:hypothetical protein T439DRAFT_374867 [Meredithblackwellia eburnea MCA 4105]
MAAAVATPSGDILPRVPHTEDPISTQLTAGGPLNPPQVGQMTALSRDTPMSVIREHFERDGYVLIKRLIDPEVVKSCRHSYFKSIQETGVFAEESNPLDGIFIGGEEALDTFVTPGSVRGGTGEINEGAAQFYLQRCIEGQRSPWFAAFSTNPQLVQFVKEFMNWEKPLLLKRQMLRSALPGGDGVPVHYDQLFFRHGPPSFLTCWTPLDDTTPERGGLMYLSDSAKLGEQMERDFAEGAKHLSEAERKSAFNTNMMRGGILHPSAGSFAAGLNRKWLMANYEAGDVAFHNPFIIHASCVNNAAGNRIMAHTDIRFVDPTQPFDERWMEYWEREPFPFSSLRLS